MPCFGDIVERLGGELIGDPATANRRASSRSNRPTPATIAFLSNPLYAKQLAASRRRLRHRRAGVYATPLLARGAAIVTADPYLYFARLTQWWAERTPTPAGAGDPRQRGRSTRGATSARRRRRSAPSP